VSEIRQYLQLLLDHDCQGGECPDCQTLDAVEALIRERLFRTVVYNAPHAKDAMVRAA